MGTGVTGKSHKYEFYVNTALQEHPPQSVFTYCKCTRCLSVPAVCELQQLLGFSFHFPTFPKSNMISEL